jgi:CRP-like cAMP-binding protein
MKDYFDTILTADLFRGLDEDQIQLLISLGDQRAYKKGEKVIQTGEHGEALYIVLSGQTEVVQEDNWGNPKIVILGTGQGFGEIAVLDAGPRTATVECISDEVTLLRIPGKALRTACEQSCCMGYRLMYNLAQDLAFKLRHRNLPQPSEE